MLLSVFTVDILEELFIFVATAILKVVSKKLVVYINKLLWKEL